MADTDVVVSTTESAQEEKHGLSTAARRKARASRPRRHSLRFLDISKDIKSGELYSLDEAIELVKRKATAKFDETIEAAINLGVDPRHGDQMVRGTTTLPYGTGKSRVVWVFARGEKVEEAKAAGADLVGAEDLVERIQKEGGANCDILVADPDVMPLVFRLGQILKQRMPNAKAGTVSPNVAQVVREIKQAKRVEYRVDKNGIIHAPIGKASFPAEHIKANLIALVSALLKARPASAKGKYLKRITLSSTMGPGIHVDPAEVQRLAEHG